MKKANRVTIRTNSRNIRTRKSNINTKRRTNKNVKKTTSNNNNSTRHNITTRHAPKNIKPNQGALKITTRNFKQNKKNESRKKKEIKEADVSEEEEEKLLSRKRRFQTAKGASPKKRQMTTKNTVVKRKPPSTKVSPGIPATKPKPKAVVKPKPVNSKPVVNKRFRVQTQAVEKKANPVIRKKEISVVVKQKPVVRMQTYVPEESSESSESESDSESENPFGPQLNVNAGTGALLLLRNIPTDITARELLMELFVNVPGIEQVSIHRDDQGNSKGMADIAFSTASEARECVKSFRDIVYRNHEIYLTLMGSNLVTTQPRKQVIGQRLKKKKKKKKDKKIITKKERVEPAKNEIIQDPEPVQEEIVQTNLNDTSSPAESPPPPLAPQTKLRITSPTCVVPETRPWNWGSKKLTRRKYDQEYVPPDWSKSEEETYYHVTMKHPRPFGSDELI